MIEGIKILIPYHPKIKLKKGDRINVDRKNLLITGGNGVGKSSLLHMVFRSLETFQRRFAGKTLAGYDIFSCFIGGCKDKGIKLIDRERKLSLDKFKELIFIENSRIYDERMTPSRITYEVFNNPELVGNPRMEKSVLESFLLEKLKDEDLLKDLNRKDFAIVDLFIDGINRYSEEIGIKKEIAYGLCHGLETGWIFKLENPLPKFFYTHLNGNIKEIKKVNAMYNYPGEGNQLIVRNLKKGKMEDIKEVTDFKDRIKWEPNSMSLGQFKVANLEKILSGDSQLILLDEPTYGLDEDNSEKYKNKIIEKGNSSDRQVIVSTNDRYLKEKLVSEKEWRHYKIN